MKSLGGFFEKFRNKAVTEVNNRLFIIEIIKKYTGIELDMKDISISSGIIKLTASNILKNEIYIKKAQILKEIQEKFTNSKISDIK